MALWFTHNFSSPPDFTRCSRPAVVGPSDFDWRSLSKEQSRTMLYQRLKRWSLPNSHSTPLPFFESLACITIHLTFFLFHVILLFAWKYSWLHKITFDQGAPAKTATTVISVSLPAFANVRIA